MRPGVFGRWIFLTMLGASSPTVAQELADRGPAVYTGAAPGVMLIRAVGIKTDQSMTSEVGSGFVISSDGYVLTASHVVPEGVQYKTLILGGMLGPATANGKTYELTLVKRSDSYDAALLRISNAPRALACSSPAEDFGDTGGNAFRPWLSPGTSQCSFSRRRVSDVGSDAITTNALVDRGNSGGPVLDARGCVIGLVYGGITSREDQPVNGVKFAVPMRSLGALLPPDLKASTTDPQPGTDADTIHVSDTLSRLQEDHGLTDTVRSYHDVIPARSGFLIEEVEAVGHNSLNPPTFQFPTPIIAPDKASISFDYSLLSGPIYDQRRGWIDMTIHTRQQRAGTSPDQTPSSSACAW